MDLKAPLLNPQKSKPSAPKRSMWDCFRRDNSTHDDIKKVARLLAASRTNQETHKTKLKEHAENKNIKVHKVGLRVIIKQLASVDTVEQTYRAIGLIDLDWNPTQDDYEDYKKLKTFLHHGAHAHQKEEEEEEENATTNETEKKQEESTAVKVESTAVKNENAGKDDKAAAAAAPPSPEDLDAIKEKLANYEPEMVPEVTFSNIVDMNSFDDVSWGHGGKYKMKEGADGTKLWVRRISFDVVFCEPFQVKNFPFDVQDLVFVLESMDMPKNEIIKLGPSRVTKKMFEIETTYMSTPEWEIKSLDAFSAKLDWTMIERESKFRSLTNSEKKIIKARQKALKKLIEQEGEKQLEELNKETEGDDTQDKTDNKEDKEDDDDNDVDDEKSDADSSEEHKEKKKKEKKKHKAGGMEKRSRMYFRLQAKRLAENILFRVILWMSLLGLVSFAIYAIDPADISSRLSYAVTMNLSVVAFQFVISSMVPHVPYLTLIDKYNLMIFGTVLLQAFFAVLSGARGAWLSDDAKLELDNNVFYIMFSFFVLMHVAAYFYSQEKIKFELSKIGLSKNYIDVLNKLEGYPTNVENGLVEIMSFSRDRYKKKKDHLRSY